MTQATLTDRTYEAVSALAKELDSLGHEIRRHEERLADLRKRQQVISQSLQALLPMLSAEKLEEFRSLQASSHLDVRRLRTTEASRFLVDKLKSDASRTWRVEELQNFLSASGQDVSEKYASNTLRKLHAQGLLTRVGRGLYRVNDTLLSLEGFTHDDME